MRSAFAELTVRHEKLATSVRVIALLEQQVGMLKEEIEEGGGGSEDVARKQRLSKVQQDVKLLRSQLD
eukprot:CAMPEP_0181291228 /NCGR_PEP_ID=MMETSP1101-20121128/1855_1 /TAXON_ID=46948 /ORGANISM="Rhodomonas abbreviata, Strain Caron Lab Isolate" /LENGTH=67 /DNA_ID=CAMNT_0023395605 /DNA_START=63 /DNA_END=263 /DNA_ORIENTATION=-